jgi:hypothetical protein
MKMEVEKNRMITINPKIQKQKEKLIKIGKQCSDLAEKHKIKIKEFYNLFEEIYGIEFDGRYMDEIVNCIDYGNSNFDLKDLENSIIFWKDNCNYDMNKDKLKNLESEE